MESLLTWTSNTSHVHISHVHAHTLTHTHTVTIHHRLRLAEAKQQEKSNVVAGGHVQYFDRNHFSDVNYCSTHRTRTMMMMMMMVRRRMMTMIMMMMSWWSWCSERLWWWLWGRERRRNTQRLLNSLKRHSLICLQKNYEGARLRKQMVRMALKYVNRQTRGPRTSGKFWKCHFILHWSPISAGAPAHQ